MTSTGEDGGTIRNFRMRFSAPMVPLGDPRAPAPVDVACPVGGTGRWIDAQNFVHEFSQALPGGLTCSFTLKPALKSLDGLAIAGQRRFVVDTGGPNVRAVLPARYDGAIQQDQVFLVATNVPADRASIAANAYCAVNGIGEKMPVDLLPAAVPARLIGQLGKDNYAAKNFLDEAGLAPGGPMGSVTALRCHRPLPPGREMALLWPAAIKGGGRTAGRLQRFDFTVIDEFTARFECSRTNPQAGCNPVEAATVRFSAPIARAKAGAIRIRLADGRLIAPTGIATGGEGEEGATNGFVTNVAFKVAQADGIAGSVILPPAIIDENGRPLANARRFPLDIRFDPAPPLVKFAANFGILEAREGGVLPLTVRNVEPALQGRRLPIGGKTLRLAGSDGDVAGWLRKIDDAEEDDFRDERRGGATVTVNHTRDRPLLDRQPGLSPTTVGLPARGKAFEVIGIPLGRPGFYVVELASPVLGRALLGRETPRYVASAALVTNMAVHFKWGRGASLAWVTALDSGAPVPGAVVQVSDSCTGRPLARGAADRFGRLRVTGLPDPETYGGCEDKNGHPLMISARAGDDFSFALTSWNKGLNPYDFELPYEWQKPSPIFHTIFDRALIRAGEAVNMKHVLRRPVAAGFAAMPLKGLLHLAHRGSETAFDVPIRLGRDGIGLSQWTAPKGAPQGDYDLSVKFGEETIETGQSLRVDEYRLPTMRATISGPKAAIVRPASVPVDLFVGYMSGGAAARLPVTIRASFDADIAKPKGWDEFTFGGAPMAEGITPLDGDNRDISRPLPATQLTALTLNAQGTAHSDIAIPEGARDGATLALEMDYPDANGETLTASQRFALHPAALRIGIKTDGWLMRKDDLRLKTVVLGLDGKPASGKLVTVRLYSREIISARRRLIGGFYAYENNARVTKLSRTCVTFSDAQGFARCNMDAGVSGEVYAVATVRDGAGNVTRAVTSVWLAGDDWWFGGDNGDRMDLVPEQREYKASDVARLQVRMPFRSATALVTVEREGVLSSFVTTLSGHNPVVEVPLTGAYAPNVYVSVLAVRGRVAGWRLWLADFAQRWHLPFFRDLAGKPTALVDLAKPSFRLGIARINVGWDTHRLAVDVKADRAAYHVRDIAQVAVRVTGADGRPPRSAEIAFAAVDEALLQLAPNDSWKLLDAMMGERALSVLSSTAQMQVVGKRHYGRKAVAAGGGGGGDLSGMNREDFRPVLLWKGRVALDANGMARLRVPLADSLSSFRLVAIATAGADRFGTGSVSVRTTQDLGIYSGVPPLVRAGDRYGASFTLRNGSPRPMTVTARATTAPFVGTARPLTVTIPAGGTHSVTWYLTAPARLDRLIWTISARSADGRAVDGLTVPQAIAPAVPIDTWAATLLRVGPDSRIDIAAPAGAIAGRGGVEVRLSDSLAPPLEGVRRYMRAYLYDCFEQRLSKAVVAGDTAAWGVLAGEIPAYQDAEGLLRFFPGSGDGSIALTAYALSMTSEAGLPIPPAARDRIVAALQAVVEGRLVRDEGYGGDKRLERLAALAALSRNGASSAALIGQIGMAPQDMSSSALIDWLTILYRTPGADPAAIAQAEAAFRARIVFAGSRIDFSDVANAPWWMLSSGDEMANRAVVALAGRPGWQDDVPRMMVGSALRQRRGHWDSTPANAWGAVAARRFESIYPPVAASGAVAVALAGSMRSARAGDPPLSLALPRVPAPLTLSHPAGAGPWAQVAVTAAVPLQRAFFAGYRIARQVIPVQQLTPGRLSRGDVLRVRLTIDAGADRNWVVVNDPIPAGATIVGDLGGQSQALAAAASGGEGAQPSYVERGLDGWRGYFAWAPRGRFTVEYVVRLNAAGIFQLPPTRVEALYSPDLRGALPNAVMRVGM